MTFIPMIALVIGVSVGALGLSILVSVWKTWWLHPLWALVIVPLGLPAISFWHFLAFNMLVHSMIGSYPSSEGKKDPEDATARWTGHIVGLLSYPVIAYYLARWYMS